MFLWVLLTLVHPCALALNNQLIGSPKVACQTESVQVEATTSDDFDGVVFVKNWRQVDPCYVVYNSSVSATRNPKFILRFENLAKCGLQLQQQTGRNVELFFMLIYSFHQELTTSNDRSFNIRCVYPPNYLFAASQLDSVPSLTAGSTIDSVAHAPSPTFEIVSDQVSNKNSDSVLTMPIGSPLTLLWHLPDDSEIYGFHVRECVAESTKGRKTNIILGGCSTDTSLVSDVHYTANNKKASVNGTAFKFPDDNNLLIKCKLELCLQEQRYLSVDSKSKNNLCKASEECSDRKKRSTETPVDVFDDKTFVLNNKIFVLDSHRNSSIEAVASSNLLAKFPTQKIY